MTTPNEQERGMTLPTRQGEEERAREVRQRKLIDEIRESLHASSPSRAVDGGGEEVSDDAIMCAIEQAVVACSMQAKEDIPPGVWCVDYARILKKTRRKYPRLTASPSAPSREGDTNGALLRCPQCNAVDIPTAWCVKCGHAWSHNAPISEKSQREVFAALALYGSHLTTCKREAGGDRCTCGFTKVLQGDAALRASHQPRPSEGTGE